MDKNLLENPQITAATARVLVWPPAGLYLVLFGIVLGLTIGPFFQPQLAPPVVLVMAVQMVENFFRQKSSKNLVLA